MTGRWRVCKRDGEWRVYHGEWWMDTFETLTDAYWWATTCSIYGTLYLATMNTLQK